MYSLLTFLLLSSPSAALGNQAPEISPSGMVAPTIDAFLVRNEGQIDNDNVVCYVDTPERTVYFEAGRVTIAFRGDSDQRYVVRLTFPGARNDVVPRLSHPLPTVVSYFRGSDGQDTITASTWKNVTYEGLWPGIDLTFRAAGQSLKYEFRVSPTSRLEDISLAFEAAELACSPDGSLRIETPAGAMVDPRPSAWEGRSRRPVSVAWKILPGDNDAQHVGFQVTDWTHQEELIIDPVLVLNSSYFGGSAWESIEDIAVDHQGRLYLVGTTDSDETTFPVHSGPDLLANGRSDAYIARISPDGTAIEYCGYIGGASDDEGHSVATTDQGEAIVVGRTTSNETTFPVRVGPDLSYNGSWDSFVAKVNRFGTGLLFCGYVGGSRDDSADCVEVDSAGRAVIGGVTHSDESTFPVYGGLDQTQNGFDDGFLAIVAADGRSLDLCGYIGGDGGDRVNALALGPSGDIYVGGLTGSDESTFPVTVGPDLTANGYWDGFVARLSPSGTFRWCGYIGGSAKDEVLGIDVRSVSGTEQLGVGGLTSSDETSFPVAIGPDLVYGDGIEDGFVALVSSDGTRLQYCGYVGGASYDEVRDVAFDEIGNLWVVGWTQSDETSLPVRVGPLVTRPAGSGDFMLGRVHLDGTDFDTLGYYGASHSFADYGETLAVLPGGMVWVAGRTGASTFPIMNAVQSTYGGATDGAFARFQGPQFTLTTPQRPIPTGQPVHFTVYGAAPHKDVWLAYSMLGYGTTPVPQLQATLDLMNPAQAAGVKKTDAQGSADWTLVIPPQYAGVSIWIQAIQFGGSSNVIWTFFL